MCIKQGLTDYLELILYVGFITDPEAIWQKITEVFQMKHIIHDETWPIIDEFFRQVPEAMNKLPTFQDVLMEKLSEGLKKGLQEGKQEGRQEGIQEDKQKVLIRLLKQKFSTVPQSVVKKIRNTQDIDQLDHWLDQILVAETIDNII